MGTLTGLTKTTHIERIEVVSIERDWVMVVERRKDANATTVTIRKASESTWNATGPVFTIEDKDTSLVSAAILGQDAGWQLRDRAIEVATFTAEDINEKAVAAEVEARCSQLDIERAKAANIAEERELLRLSLKRDHSLDKHITAYVEGCESCDSGIVTATDYMGSYEGSVEREESDLGF